MSDTIKITGIREFQKALRTMGTDLPRQVRIVLNEAGEIIVDYDRSQMPRRSGRAIASVKARSSQRQARVAIGGSRAPYVPWLDFGGEGRRKGRPTPRPFLREGRYTYKGLRVRRDAITEVMARGLAELAKNAGMDVS